METLKSTASRRMDRVYRTGYPHPINLFATFMLTLLPLLSPFSGEAGGVLRPPLFHGLAILLALLYLLIWSQIRVSYPERSPRFYQIYTLAQTLAVSLIYALDGGLTRFLFVMVAVQAVYISPARRWGPYLGTLAVLWLTLYLVLSANVPGASKVAIIGMYLLYLIFAALVTFTTVQQERQNKVAQQLLEGVDHRHHTLRAYDQTVEHRSETEERERLAQTICATLLSRLGDLSAHLQQLQSGQLKTNRHGVRAARMVGKAVLAAVREAVRTLRPGEDGELDDEGGTGLGLGVEADVSPKWTDPLRLYHVWNMGVIVVTTGVLSASDIVAQSGQWLLLLLSGLALICAYGMSLHARQPWNRTLLLVIQAGLISWMVILSAEPLMNQLLLVVAAQMVFLVPPVNRWLLAAVFFPTLLAGVSLWLTGLFQQHPLLLLAQTAAYGVTNFFGAVMAFMTMRHVEARNRAVLYAEQLAAVNRLLELRLEEVRRMAIARERVRMAREIHDGLGHHLTVVIVELQHAEELAGEDPDGALQHIGSAQEVVQSAMALAREMVDSLERFDRPLEIALDDLVAAWRKPGGPKINLRVVGEFSVLATSARITLYRAVQESLTNVQKHARASLIEITLLQLPDRVSLTIANDHRGKAPTPEAEPGGFGLLGLKERADALQGQFWAGSRRGGGYELKLVLPLGE